MPIGDLLAQINGDKSQSTSPAPSRPAIATAPKRKADDDLRNTVSNKMPRTGAAGPNPSLASKSTGAHTPAPRPVDKPTTTTGYRGSAARPSDRVRPAPRPVGNGAAAAKPGGSVRPLSGPGAPKVPNLPSRPSPSAPVVPAKNGAPPKKGSFAEILARGQKAQQSMGQIGKIQHKPVEKILTKKEREEMAKVAKKDAKAPASRSAPVRQPSKFQGTARPSSGVSSRNGAGSKVASRNGTADRAGDSRALGKARALQEEQEKKLKKAAVATTGYTGTARPKPGTSTTKKKPAPGGALLNVRPAPRYGGGAKRSRYDEEEEEEFDDFIEYDDEDDDAGPRYTYDSDGSSDMEAGMDDVWNEELEAERAARREDLEQEKLEKKLKAEKEERKRRFWEQQQQGRR